jgi:hypothetical protein
MSGGVWVEQMDPLAMLKSVASCGLAWDNYYRTVLSKLSGGSCPDSSGGSSSGQFTQSRPSKRPFTAANQAAGRTADRQHGQGGVQEIQCTEAVLGLCFLYLSICVSPCVIRGLEESASGR